MYNYINVISNDPKVKSVFYNKENKEYVLEFLRSFEKSDKDINYIYIGLPDGSLIINNYKPPDGYNATIRPWYKIAIEQMPDISEGLPYQEIKTKEWLISLSKVIIDEKNRINGVLAIDSSLMRLTKLLNLEIDQLFKSQNTFVITNNGLIIIHKDPKMLMKNLYKICNKTVKQGKFKYTLNNITKIGIANNIDNVKWKVITEVNEKEIYMFIFEKITFVLLFVIFISAFIGWILSRNLSENIISPIIELRKRTKVILNGKEPLTKFFYPENEIGQIAKDLEKLTQNGLYLTNLKLKRLTDELKILSETDQLTGLYNRRRMENELNAEFMRYKRYKRTFSLILFDIDHFKLVNDHYGHNIGDYVLKEISRLFTKYTRESDIVARWGGEEFLILCPETKGFDAFILAEKMRKIIRGYNFGIDKRVTISAGVAEINENFANIDRLLTHADKNLYKAKFQGRDRCVFE